MATARFLFQSLRPRQWIKNGFILVPLPFAQKVFHVPSVLRCVEGMIIFCLLTGGVYLINDLVDLESDRQHPVKKNRPLAQGLIPSSLAKVAAAFLISCALASGTSLGTGFFLILVAYLAIQVLYNYRLKETVILDIFCVSGGFFLRVVAGCAAIHVAISHWLIICSILISMFLALAKRRHELVLLGESHAGNHRKVLSEYSPQLLDQMIAVVTAATLLSYMLYCISTETIEKFQTDHMIYTFPFVLYGIFRYLYLIHQKNEGGSPEKILVSDVPILLSLILWSVASMLIVYGVM
ncbi:MAG: decaprenyl-phosphate phosphoribosyltransferase [Thermodesulfobacteriota bacterium]|nr:decaprenyl-phosphate phosphoribosyltransferase [Thermodesulfobacteriota bacterium]